MSGSGGSGYSGGGNDYQDNCERLIIDTILASPKEEIIDLLEVGDILDVAFYKIGETVIVGILKGGELAGGVASPQINQLRNCLEKGQEFIATVQSIKGGQIKVRISAKRTS